MTWAEHTVTVDQSILDAAGQALDANPPVSSANYAVTDVYQRLNVYVLSVVALPAGTTTGWRLSDALWIGTVAVRDEGGSFTAAVEGTAAYDTITSGVIYAEAGGDGGGGAPVFPWMPGKRALYGDRGLHDAGYGLTGWLAIDWVSGDDFGSEAAPPLVFASETADITYVCRDSTSVAVRAGNFLYAHLQDNANLHTGYTLRKGVGFANLVYGSFDDTCGWASQRPNHYHVHWGFVVPTGAQHMQFENWDLDLSTGVFRRGDETVRKLQWMTATGEAAAGDDIPTAGSTGSFWDGPISAIYALARATISQLREKASFNLAINLARYAGVMVRVYYIMVRSNFNMTITLWVMGVIVVLEPVRLLYALWMLIKRAIPFAG